MLDERPEVARGDRHVGRRGDLRGRDGQVRVGVSVNLSGGQRASPIVTTAGPAADEDERDDGRGQECDRGHGSSGHQATSRAAESRALV